MREEKISVIVPVDNENLSNSVLLQKDCGKREMKMGQPKISVIIPVYNMEQYLCQSLDSVVNQTLKDIEIICVDDCSSDHSLDILKNYAKRDSRIRIVSYDENKSASQARKDGVLMSSGKYIMFLDADDTYEVCAFEELYTKIEHHDVDILQFGTYIDAETTVSKQTIAWFEKFAKPYHKSLKGKNVFEGCFDNQLYGFNLWNKIYRSELCKKAFSYVEDGFFPKAQDLYAFFIISWFAQSYYGIPEKYYHYAYGRGITGANKQISAENFARSCSQSRVAEKCKQFLENQNVWDIYENVWKTIYTNLLNECCNSWLNQVKPGMTAEAFDVLVNSFGIRDVNVALEKQAKSRREEIAVKTMGATCLSKYSEWFFPVYDVVDPKDALVPDGFQKVVPVVFATNDKYAPYAGVAIQSIIEHMTPRNFYRIYVFHTGIEKRYVELLTGLSNKQMQVQCVNVTYQIDAHCSKLYEKGYFTKEMYYRFVIPEILSFYDKVVYLDCDLIVEEDIANIIPLNMDDQYLAGVKNPMRKKNVPVIERYLEIPLQDYINSGVLVFNIKSCIDNEVVEKCFGLVSVAAKRKFWCPDQDIINRVCYGHIMILPYKWNYMWQFLVEATPEHMEVFQEILDEVRDEFAVLHFTSSIKPWSHLQHPLAKHFWHYARKSCFYEEILQKNLLGTIRDSNVLMNQNALGNQATNSSFTVGAETDKIRRLERELAEARQEIQNIHNSWTYRIGRFITWLPRKIRGGCRCYQEHGFAYTLERLFVHLHLKKDPYKLAPLYTQQNVEPVKKTLSTQQPAEVIRDYEYYSRIPEKDFEKELICWYQERMKAPLDLDNPKTFNEKIQWLKLYDSTPLKTKLADKYLVREWIAEQIGEQYLIPLLGVWDNFDEIDFDQLPDQFVLKTNHGSGGNIIVPDKSEFKYAIAKQRFDNWMKQNYAFYWGFELHYMNISPKIIAEKYMAGLDGDIYDYRFFCFNGVPKYVWVDIGSGTSHHKRSIFDMNWELQEYLVNYPALDPIPEKPENFDEMVSISTKLCKEFAFVRIDLYSLKSKTYFGEMTFTPQSGTGRWESEKHNRLYGDMLQLPPKSPIPSRKTEENR